MALFGVVVCLENKSSPTSQFSYTLQQVFLQDFAAFIVLSTLTNFTGPAAKKHSPQHDPDNTRLCGGDDAFLQMYGVWITPNIALDIVKTVPSLNWYFSVCFSACVHLLKNGWLQI